MDFLSGIKIAILQFGGGVFLVSRRVIIVSPVPEEKSLENIVC